MRDASVTGAGVTLASTAGQQLDVLAASYRVTEGREIGTFDVRGAVTNPAEYTGAWARVDYGNDVSYLYRILGIRPSEEPGQWRVEIGGRPGLEKGPRGWTHIGYPFKAGSAQARLHLDDCATHYSPQFLAAVGGRRGRGSEAAQEGRGTRP